MTVRRHLKINNNFPAKEEVCLTLYKRMLTISSTIFNFRTESDNMCKYQH